MSYYNCCGIRPQ